MHACTISVIFQTVHCVGIFLLPTPTTCGGKCLAKHILKVFVYIFNVELVQHGAPNCCNVTNSAFSGIVGSFVGNGRAFNTHLSVALAPKRFTIKKNKII